MPIHLPTEADIDAWPEFTPTSPLRVLVSACLLGVRCGTDGSSYGAPYAHLQRLLTRADVSTVAFCPEDFAFGTPREVPDIHGGTGFDVLDGRAQVLRASGEDWTDAMVAAARAMLAVATHNGVHLALLTDISAACGSQVIYLGARADGVHQAGHGVCAALLVRNGIKVVSQRDHRTLGRIFRKLEPESTMDPNARDHHETVWYVEHLSGDDE